MKEILPEDLSIAVEAAEMILSDYQMDLIEKHQKIYSHKLGEIDPKSQEALKIYAETMVQVPGVSEAYDLLDQLVDFNLNRLMNSKQN